MLTGKFIGLSAIWYHFPVSFLLALIPVDYVLPFKLKFTGPLSAGFTVTRHFGLRTRFSVEIHDPALDRLVVLTAVVAVDDAKSNDIRKFAVALTANPFRD